MHIFKHKHYFNFKRLFILAIAAHFLSLSIFIPFPATVQAIDPMPYTLFYDEKSVEGLRIAARDGGIGESDTKGALSKTYLITKGGRLGTQRLSLDASKSDKYELPIYSKQYYCTLKTDTQDLREPILSTQKPPENHEYLTLTMGVAIADRENWSKLTVDKDYPTRVGLVNSVSSPDSNGSAGVWHRPANTKGDDPSKWTQAVNTWVSADDEKNGVSSKLNKVGPNGDAAPNFMKGCLPNPAGDIGNKTSNYQKLSDADKQGWDAEAKAANLGEDVASAAGSSSGSGSGDDQISCETQIKSALSWIACPVIEMGQNMTDFVFKDIVEPLLNDVPITTDPNDGSYKAWAQFRVIANILLIASLLAIVYSQAKGSK